MLTLYDYLPSQNGWKIRQMLSHLRIEHRTAIVSIFEGEGRSPAYLSVNPSGAVPAIQYEDGRTLAESNAILFHLAQGSQWLSADPFEQAKTLQWLSFEADYIQSTLGTVRHWRMTGKLDRRPAELVKSRQQAGRSALEALNRELSQRPFLVGEYSVADISAFAYAHLAEEAAVGLSPYLHVRDWIARVQAQPGHLAERYAYDVDPYSSRELT